VFAGAASRCRGAGAPGVCEVSFPLLPLFEGAERREAHGLASPPRPLQTALEYAFEAYSSPFAIGTLASRRSTAAFS
jgi:hypothetical protein